MNKYTQSLLIVIISVKGIHGVEWWGAAGGKNYSRHWELEQASLRGWPLHWNWERVFQNKRVRESKGSSAGTCFACGRNSEVAGCHAGVRRGTLKEMRWEAGRDGRWSGAPRLWLGCSEWRGSVTEGLKIRLWMVPGEWMARKVGGWSTGSGGKWQMVGRGETLIREDYFGYNLDSPPVHYLEWGGFSHGSSPGFVVSSCTGNCHFSD